MLHRSLQLFKYARIWYFTCLGAPFSKSLNGAKVLVLDIAYKRDIIDDLRESPSPTIIELLRKEEAKVSYNDPFFPFVGRGRKYNLQLSNPLEHVEQYDCMVSYH